MNTLKTQPRTESRQSRPKPPTGSILIVDDEKRMTASVGALLMSDGHQVTEATSGKKAISLLQEKAFDVVVVDVRMPGIGGLEVLRAARDLNPDRPVIMMTAHASLETAVKAINEGAYDYLLKPIDLTEMQLTVQRAIEKHRLHLARDRFLKKLQEKTRTLSSRVAELNALHEVGATLSTTGEIDELLKAILNLATGVIDANYGSIMLVDPQRQTLKIAATSGRLSSLNAAAEVPLGNSISGQVVRTGEPVIIEDVENHPNLSRRNRPQFETSSFICAPLKTPAAILGVISLSDKRSGNSFSQDDMRLLITLAAQAAMAIKDSQNFQKVRRRLSEVKALYKLSNRLTTVERPDQMVAAVFETLQVLTECDRIQWWEWQPEGECLSLAADTTCGQDGQELPAITVRLTAHAVGVEEECAAALRVTLRATEPDNAFETIFSLPVRSAEHPLGVFALIRHHRMEFLDYERNLISLVGTQAERIFERQRTLLNASRLVTMGSMISEISHDLRKPLTNIRGSLQVLGARLGTNAEHTTLLKDTEQEIVRLATLVTELVDFSNPKRYRTQPRDLAPVLRRAVSLTERAAAKAGVSLETDIPERLPAVFCDENQIIEAMLNILMNAIEAMTDGGTLTVTAAVGPAADGRGDILTIRATDTGPGMTPAELDRIFERYYTTKSTGTGLGLPVVQRIIASYQGEIRAESTLGQGTTFIIELPIL